MQLNQLQTIILYVSMIYLVYKLAIRADKKNNVVPLLFGFFIISIIVGFRDTSVGLDTHQYVYLFENRYYIWMKDIGFVEFTRLLVPFVSSSTYLFIIAFVTYLLFSLGAWRLRNDTNLPKLVLFLIVSILFPSMNTIRQCLALSLVFFTFKDLLERRYIKFLLAVAIATTIHSSSVVAVSFVFFRLIFSTKRNIDLKKVIISIISFLVFPIALYYVYINYLGTIFHSKLDTYFSSKNIIGGLYGLLQFVFINYIIYKEFGKKIRNEDENIKLLCILSIIAVLGNLLGYFYPFMNRIFTMYMLTMYVLLAKQWDNKVQNIYNNKRKRISYSQIISLFLIFYPFFSTLIVDGYRVMKYCFRY